MEHAYHPLRGIGGESGPEIPLLKQEGSQTLKSPSWFTGLYPYLGVDTAGRGQNLNPLPWG